MRKAYGRATDRAARIHKGQEVFTVDIAKANVPFLMDAFRRAKLKMSGSFTIRQTPYKSRSS